MRAISRATLGFFCQYGNHTFSVLIIDTFVPCGVERGTPVSVGYAVHGA